MDVLFSVTRFELAVGPSVVAPDIHRLGLNLREAADGGA